MWLDHISFDVIETSLLQVDHLINQNHLFKRSIILIKAWCYYESRILGAHHGLISTYALETLVLYIFHVFNNSFAGPLEVLVIYVLLLFLFLNLYLISSLYFKLPSEDFLVCYRFFIDFWNSLATSTGIIFVSAYGVLYPLVHFQM